MICRFYIFSNSRRWLIQYFITVSKFTSNELEWLHELCRLLTPLFGLFTHWSLVRLKIVWIELTRWIAAFNETPTSLLFGDDACIEGIVTEGCIGCIGRASPTSECWHCNRKHEKGKQNDYYHKSQAIPWISNRLVCPCAHTLHLNKQ